MNTLPLLLLFIKDLKGDREPTMKALKALMAFDRGQLASRIYDMWSKDEFLDITIICKRKEKVKAHKVVLAACSPFFLRLLQMQGSDVQESTLNLELVRCLSAWKSFIKDLPCFNNKCYRGRDCYFRCCSDRSTQRSSC